MFHLLYVFVILPAVEVHGHVAPQRRVLQVGTRRQRPPHISPHLPPFPDPHTYIRTPVRHDVLYIECNLPTENFVYVCIILYSGKRLRQKKPFFVVSEETVKVFSLYGTVCMAKQASCEILVGYLIAEVFPWKIIVVQQVQSAPVF